MNKTLTFVIDIAACGLVSWLASPYGGWAVVAGILTGCYGAWCFFEGITAAQKAQEGPSEPF